MFKWTIKKSKSIHKSFVYLLLLWQKFIKINLWTTNKNSIYKYFRAFVFNNNYYTNKKIYIKYITITIIVMEKNRTDYLIKRFKTYCNNVCLKTWIMRHFPCVKHETLIFHRCYQQPLSLNHRVLHKRATHRNCENSLQNLSKILQDSPKMAYILRSPSQT